MIYFTSDLHFYYSSDPKVGRRRFATAEEKNAFLIEQWNATVGAEDEVYLLGDVSDGTGEETGRILGQLNGRKYLIIGNHDKYLDDPAFCPILFVRIAERRFDKRVEEEMRVKACSNQPKVTLAVAMRQRLAQMKKESMKKRTYRRAK